MDYRLTEAQELLSRAAREFLAAECPKALVRDSELTPTGLLPDLWQKAVDLGWAGLAFSSQAGGGDGSITDVAILAEEIGRAVAPIPFLAATVGGYVVAAAAGEASPLVSRIARGDVLLPLALVESAGSHQPADIVLRAEWTGDAWRLSGEKLFVESAGLATGFLVVARTGAGETDLTVFQVDYDAPGVTVELDVTTAGDRLGAITFANVEIQDSARLGPISGGWPAVERGIRLGQILLAATAVGLAQQAHDLAVEYSKNRIQFGRPIGSFQALQHKMADRAVEIDSLRYLTYQAAWLADRGADFATAATKAKAYAASVCGQIATDCAHMFGGYGMVLETDVQLYYRRLRVIEVRFGETEELLDQVAVALGL